MRRGNLGLRLYHHLRHGHVAIGHLTIDQKAHGDAADDNDAVRVSLHNAFPVLK